MRSKMYSLQLFLLASGLLLLGGLGAYWPTWVGADAIDRAAAPLATIDDAITYQGYLTDETGVPLNGSFTMRFQIYNAPSGGDLLWDSGSQNVAVDKGLFETRFAISTDIFNGEALWVAQTIAGELLSPRQEILPAPLAHTLRPGAVIKGTGNAIPNNYIVDVQMNNDTFAFNRGAISGQSTTGNAIYGLANNGRAIYGQTQDGFAVYGFDGGSTANRGYGGYFYSTNGIGVYGYSNGNRSHPNIFAPGVYGQSNQGVGVYGRGDTSDSYSFYNEGGYFVGGKGLYANGTDPAGQGGYGARIFSDNYRGMYVRGDNNYFDAYFGGLTGISTNGIVDRSGALQSLVVNVGDAAIEPGDLVAMAGVAESPEGGEPMLAVAKLNATNRSAVIGVAKSAMNAETVQFEDGSSYVDFAPVAGSIAPEAHLVIITQGLAPAVNLSSLAILNEREMWAIGAKVALSTGGEMQLATGQAEQLVIGKVADVIDETSGTIALYLDID